MAVTGFVKKLRDIMRLDAGINGDVQLIEQIMNQKYKVIWSRSKGCNIIVPEIAKNTTKGGISKKMLAAVLSVAMGTGTMAGHVAVVNAGTTAESTVTSSGSYDNINVSVQVGLGITTDAIGVSAASGKEVKVTMSAAGGSITASAVGPQSASFGTQSSSATAVKATDEGSTATIVDASAISSSVIPRASSRMTSYGLLAQQCSTINILSGETEGSAARNVTISSISDNTYYPSLNNEIYSYSVYTTAGSTLNFGKAGDARDKFTVTLSNGDASLTGTTNNYVTLDNKVTIINNGSFNNIGILNNNGTLKNVGSFYNTGTVNNNAIIYNYNDNSTFTTNPVNLVSGTNAVFKNNGTVNFIGGTEDSHAINNNVITQGESGKGSVVFGDGTTEYYVDNKAAVTQNKVWVKENANVTNDAVVTVNSNVQVNGTLYNNSKIDGAVEVHGRFVYNSGAEVTGNVTAVLGSIIEAEAGTMATGNGKTITNDGTLILKGGTESSPSVNKTKIINAANDTTSGTTQFGNRTDAAYISNTAEIKQNAVEVVNNAHVTNTSTGTIEAYKMKIKGAGATVTNEGTITATAGGLDMGSAAVLVNKGTVNVGSVALNNSDGTLTNEQTGTINGDVSNTSGSFTNAGKVNGSVYNTGTFVLQATGKVTDSITNRAKGNMTAQVSALNASGSVQNDGTLTLETTSNTFNSRSITGSGELIIDKNASIVNNVAITQGTITNNGIFDNSPNASLTGSLTNNGSLNNSGTITGSFVNNGNFTNNGTLTGNLVNNGIVTLGATSTALTGSVTNNSGAIISSRADRLLTSGSNRVVNNGTLDLTVQNQGSTTQLYGSISGAGTTLFYATGINGTNANIINHAAINQKYLEINDANTSFTNDTDGSITADVDIVSGSLSNKSTINGSVTNSGTLVNLHGQGTITGNVVNNASGEVNAYLSDIATGEGSTFTNNGKFILDGELSKDIAGTGTTVLQNDISLLGENASWTIAGTLNLNNNTVKMSELTGQVYYNTLSVGKLTGSGNIAIDANLASGTSDKIVITGAGSDATLNLSSIVVRGDGLELGENANAVTYVNAADKAYLSGLNYNVAGSSQGSTSSATTHYKYTFTAGSEAGKLNVYKQNGISLKEFVEGTNGGNDVVAYTVNEDYEVSGSQGTTASPEISSGVTRGTNLGLAINSGVTLKSADKSNGITVADGYTFGIIGPTDGTKAKISGFATALKVNAGAALYVDNIIFSGNTIAVDNSGTTYLAGVTAGTVTNEASGILYLSGNDNAINSISNYGKLDILGNYNNTGTITTSVDNLTVESTGSFTNDGKLLLIGGTESAHSVLGTAIKARNAGEGTLIFGDWAAKYYIDNKADINQNSITVTEDTRVENSGAMTGSVNVKGEMVNKSKITGDVRVDSQLWNESGAEITGNVSIANGIFNYGGTVSGTIENDGTLNLNTNLVKDIAGSGNTVLNQDITLNGDNSTRNISGTLDLNGKSVIMNDPTETPQYGTLSASKLIGTGYLSIDADLTDINNIVNDTLNITGSSTSNAELYLQNILLRKDAANAVDGTTYSNALTYVTGNTSGISTIVGTDGTGRICTSTSEHRYVFTAGSTAGKLDVAVSEPISVTEFITGFIEDGNIASNVGAFDITKNTSTGDIGTTNTIEGGIRGTSLVLGINDGVTLSGGGSSKGITVADGYSLQILGPTDSTSSIITGYATALTNNSGGVLAINGVTLTGNGTDIRNSGTAYVVVTKANRVINDATGVLTVNDADDIAQMDNAGRVNITGSYNNVNSINTVTGGLVIAEGSSFTNDGTLTLTGGTSGAAAENTLAVSTKTAGKGILNFGNGTDAAYITNSAAISQSQINILANAAVTSDAAITGAVSNNGTMTSNATIAGDVTNSGTMTSNAAITGNVTNSGTMTSNAAVTGNVTNSGTFTNKSSITGEITNAGTYNYLVSSTETSHGVNTNVIKASADGKGDLELGDGVNAYFIDNEAAVTQNLIHITKNANVTNKSSLTGNVQVDGTLTNEAQASIIGNVSVSGILNLYSLVNGNITNDGTLNLYTNLDQDILGSGTTVLQQDISVNDTNNIRTIAGTLDLNGKSISMNNTTTQSGYGALSVGKLTGTGSLSIDADLSSISSAITNDKIFITGIGSDAQLRLSNIVVRADAPDDVLRDGTAYLMTYADADSADKLSGITYTVGADNSTNRFVTSTSKYKYDFRIDDSTAKGQLKLYVDDPISVAEFIRGRNSNDTDASDIGSFAITEDISTANDLGTTYTAAGGLRGTNLILGFGKGVTLNGNGSTDGVTVADGYTLQVLGPDNDTTSVIKGFKTALTNNASGTLVVNGLNFTGNGTDVSNSGTASISSTTADSIVNNAGGVLNIDATDNIARLTNTGTINIGGDYNNVNAISTVAGGLNVADGSSFTNDGTLILTGGTADNAVKNAVLVASKTSGMGTLNFGDGTNAAYITNNAAVRQQNVGISEKSVVTNKADVWADLTNSGTFNNAAGAEVYGNVVNNQGAVMTASLADLAVENDHTVTNNGTFNMTGNLVKNIAGSGTTVLQQDISLLGTDGSRTVEGTIDLNGKAINMLEAAESANYNTLTAGKLTGSGDLDIDVDLANQIADKIYVTGTGSDAIINLRTVLIRSNGLQEGVNIDVISYVEAAASEDVFSITYKINGSSDGIFNQRPQGENVGTESATTQYRYIITKGSTAGKLNIEKKTQSVSLLEFITGQGDAKNVQAYTIDENHKVAGELGTTATAEDSTRGRALTIGVNRDASLLGDGSSNGVTVADGYTLNLTGQQASETEGSTQATMTGFGTALTNNGTLQVKDMKLTGNKTDIVNNAELQLNGGNNIDKIENYGKMTVASGTCLADVLNDGTMQLDDDNTIGTVTGTGTTNMTSGTTDVTSSLTQNEVNVSGAGTKLNVQGTAVATDTVSIGSGAALDAKGGLTVASLTNAGTVQAEGNVKAGTLTNSGTYTQTGGSFNVTGDMTNNEGGSVTLSSLSTSTGNRISGKLTNQGTFSLKDHTDLTASSFTGNLLDIDATSSFTVDNAEGETYIDVIDSAGKVSTNGNTTVGKVVQAGTLNVQGTTTVNGTTDMANININDNATVNLQDTVTNTTVTGSSMDKANLNISVEKLLTSNISSINNVTVNVAESGSSLLEKAINNDAVVASITGTSGTSSNIESLKNSQVTYQEGRIVGTGATVFDAEGHASVKEAPNRTNEAMLQSLSSASCFARIEGNDIRKRLGDLRMCSDKDFNGVWARNENGKLEGKGVDHDFHKFQLGYDRVVSDSWRIGGAFSYTNGTSSYSTGKDKISTYGLAAYGSYTGVGGDYADIIARIGVDKVDINTNYSSGKLSMPSFALSAEVGRTIQLKNNLFVEPQAELMFAHTNGDSFMSNGVLYDVSSLNSLTGRIGVGFGYRDKKRLSNVYTRLSLLHEFAGDRSLNVSNNYISRQLWNNGSSTWGELAIGAQFQTSKATYVYTDIERTFGAPMDEKYRLNIGLRYSF